jgi:hypothetical protein
LVSLAESPMTREKRPTKFICYFAAMIRMTPHGYGRSVSCRFVIGDARSILVSTVAIVHFACGSLIRMRTSPATPGTMPSLKNVTHSRTGSRPGAGVSICGIECTVTTDESSNGARRKAISALTLRSTGPAGTWFDLRSASRRRAGYLQR